MDNRDRNGVPSNEWNEWQDKYDYVPEPQHDKYDNDKLPHQIQTTFQTNSELTIQC